MPSYSADPRAGKFKFHVLSITANSDNTLITKYHLQDRIPSPKAANLRWFDAHGRVVERNMTRTPTVKKAAPTTPVILCERSFFSLPRLSTSAHEQRRVIPGFSRRAQILVMLQHREQTRHGI